MQFKCNGSCETLVGFRCRTLVGYTGEAPETITFLVFLQPWELAAAVGNAFVNALFYVGFAMTKKLPL